MAFARTLSQVVPPTFEKTRTSEIEIMDSTLKQARKAYGDARLTLESVMLRAEILDGRMGECQQPSPVTSVGAVLFSKAYLHAHALLQILPASNGSGLYNLPSGAALTRVLAETFVAFRYQATETSDPQEMDFRFALLNYHDRHKRRAFMTAAEQSDEIKLAEARLEAARVRLEATPFFKSQSKADREHQLKGKSDMARTHRQIAVDAGIQESFWSSTYIFLSQFVHASPLATSHFGKAVADHPQAAKNVRLFAAMSSGLLSLMMLDLFRIIPDCRNKLAATDWAYLEEQASRIRNTIYGDPEAVLRSRPT